MKEGKKSRRGACRDMWVYIPCREVSLVGCKEARSKTVEIEGGQMRIRKRSNRVALSEVLKRGRGSSGKRSNFLLDTRCYSMLWS